MSFLGTTWVRVNLPFLRDLLIETFLSWSRHRGQKMGAALSYYAAFSLGPLVILLFSITSLVFNNNPSQAIVDQFNNLMGKQAGDTVRDILAHAASNQTAGWNSVLSVLILFFGASGAFGELQDSLNQIWEVPPRKQPWRAMLKERVISFLMVFVLGIFMLASVLLSTLIQSISRELVSHPEAAYSRI